MVSEKRIDSFSKRKRTDFDCEAHAPAVHEPEETTEETPIQPSLLLLKFGQQNHEEQGHQTHRDEV